jgi:Spy/CpxP family protein refolding chaperone
MINKQNRSKVFIAIIAILLVANIAMVSFFLLKKDGDKREKRPEWKTVISGFLKTEIGFDTVQLKQYDSLSNRHRDNMKKMMDSLRITKDKQFKELAAANFSDSAMNTVADRSAANQKMMELRMFNHLRKIRLLCTPEQQPKFDSLFGKVLKRRGGENKNIKQVKDK